MSSLLGICSAGDSGIRLDADLYRAMLAQLPEYPERIGQIKRNSLWLAAEDTKLASAPWGEVAFEGYLPRGVASLPDVFKVGRTDLALKLPLGEFSAFIGSSERDNRFHLLRSLSGGERLYYLQNEGLILFSSTVRPLLVYQPQNRSFNMRKRKELVMTGLTLFGTDTLFREIREVLPGHLVSFENGILDEYFYGQDILHPLTGDPESLARGFRQSLTESVQLAIGDSARVAVALSGGIDSAAITAAVTDVVGPDNVVAFTHVFDDPTHNDKTPFASDVCQWLGIRQHKVYRITFSDFLKAIPETVWRAESFVHWPKSFLLPSSRYIKAHGFEQYLSGFGIGSHMAYFRDLSRLAGGLLKPDLLFRLFRRGQFSGQPWLQELERLHPGLAIPNRRLYFLILSLMRAQGMISPVSDYYPAEFQLLLGEDSQPELDGRASIERELQIQSFSHLVSCIDVTRWEKPLREIGANRISPAHFASCLPYAYLHCLPRPALWSQERGLRPGKHLLRLGFKDALPDSVLYRKKSWDDAVVSPTWFRAGIRWMDRVASHHSLIFDDYDKECVNLWDRRSPQAAVTGLRFWHKIFLEMEPTQHPPTWEVIANSRP